MLFRRKRGIQPEPAEDLLPGSALEEYGGDLSIFRSDHWEPMKVWLPEPLDEILRQLADHRTSSRSVLIRRALFVYVYGQYAFEQMRADKDGFFYDDGIRYSRSPNRAPSLGKNTRNYKVFLPRRLREDLATLANQSRLKLSHFTREVLISAFMGHQALAEREAMLQLARRQPANWPPEQDETASAAGEE